MINFALTIFYMNLLDITIVDARKMLDNKEITAVELTRACLARIERFDIKIHACLTVCADEALAAALMADERLAKGECGGLLGIPYLAKDNIMTKGIKTTAASKMLADYVAPYDATVIKKLKTAGAILLGKTNLDEFAHGASTEYSAFGPTRNPWDLDKVPGGSSGGSAAAVASGMCLFALGTDTGGSVRHPAAFCGVVGLKPTYGLCSRFGLISMTSSTDVPGVLAKTAKDAKIILSVLAGHDEYDATTLREPLEATTILPDLRGVKIGIPKEYFVDLPADMQDKIKETIFRIQDLGATTVDVSLPHTKYGVSVYYIITPSEISSNLARFDGIRYGLSAAQDKNLADAYMDSRGLGFGAEVKRRIMLGTYALSSGYYDAYYLQAQKVRTKIIEDFTKAFAEVDLILSPTTMGPAFDLGADKDPLSMYLEDVFLTPASLAGLPAVSIPCGRLGILPVGAQLIGPHLSDRKLLTIAEVFGKSLNWKINPLIS
jgi:aspartyl-tRNA(Asn)/glutamyl-tRNA(Gln) amidotransferase subunit A